MIGLSGHPIAFRVDEVALIRGVGAAADPPRSIIGQTAKDRSQRMRKPNYRFDRAERDRAKKAKKDEKLKLRQERAATHQPDAPQAERGDDEPAPE
jgi:hypothetical protein